MDEESAIKLCGSGWWEKYPPEMVTFAQLGERRLCLPLDKFQQATEAALGRPVWMHEFIHPGRLRKELLDRYAGPVLWMEDVAKAEVHNDS